MTLKVTQVVILGTACFIATNMVGCKDDEDDDCDDNACRCWATGTAASPNDDNINDWAELAKFNTCCFECGVAELGDRCTVGADPGTEGKCNYEDARDSFRACGATLPDAEPENFPTP